MINSQIEAYTLKHNRTPSNINDLINDGLIKKDKTMQIGRNNYNI